jgi:FtsH ternary system-associated peptide
MSAVDTALRVLQWSTAAEPGQPVQTAPPEGDLTDPQELAGPPPDITAAVTGLAARTAARLRLDGPAAAERRPVGAGAVVLAAAVGARGRAGLAAEAVRAVPPPRSLWDALAHHAVVAPALRHCAADPVLAGRLRDASPLTALLDRPTEAGEAAAELLLEDVLLEHPHGRRLLVTVYCEAPASPGQALWRGQVLDRLRMTERELVLDVYEAALLRHLPAHRSLLDRAQAALAPPPHLPAARPVAHWWAALARLERSHPRLVKARTGITRHYLAGVRLFRQFERLEAMTA